MIPRTLIETLALLGSHLTDAAQIASELRPRLLEVEEIDRLCDFRDKVRKEFELELAAKRMREAGG